MNKIVRWFDLNVLSCTNRLKILILYLKNFYSQMATQLKISLQHLTPEKGAGRVFDMTGRCAFALCVKGEFDIKILNEEYHVGEHCVFACMPFVNIEVLRVSKPSEILLGGLRLEDVMSVIQSTINSSDLIAIQQTPLVRITDEQYRYLTTSIEMFLDEVKESQKLSIGSTGEHIHREVMDLHSRLLVAQVLKVYFTNLPMDLKVHTHKDMVFQSFLLGLHANFREQRNVGFYAMRSGVSMKYFSTIIRQLSGNSPSEWIEMVVVGEAKMLLSDRTRNIKEIATMLNFPDAPTFTKYFLRVTGMTPKAYRQTIN